MKALKALKALIKPFEAPQRSTKIKIFISIQLSEMNGSLRVKKKTLVSFVVGSKDFIFKNTFLLFSSNTFEKVQKKSDQVWKYERYDLVIEYHNRPGLVPPFMILAHVWSMVTYIYRRFYKKKTEQIRNELRKSHNLIDYFSIVDHKYYQVIKISKYTLVV